VHAFFQVPLADAPKLRGQLLVHAAQIEPPSNAAKSSAYSSSTSIRVAPTRVRPRRRRTTTGRAASLGLGSASPSVRAPAKRQASVNVEHCHRVIRQERRRLSLGETSIAERDQRAHGHVFRGGE
jgi:hypothetical protein